MPSSSSNYYILIKLFIIFIIALFIIKKINNYLLESLKTETNKKQLNNEDLDNKFDLRKTNNIIKVESQE